VREVAAALDQLQQETGLDIPIHVDAASGGFVAPFVHPDLVWDFRLPRVRSINASGHKFGLAPLGCGWIIWREAADLPDDLIFRVDYLGGDMPTFALNFSRPGGQVIAQYYNFIRLGREGYTKIQKACVEVGAWFSDEVAKLGPFEAIYDGRGGLPGCSWKIKDGIDPGYNLYDLSERLRIRGWQVAAYPLPANRRDTVIQRVIARHGFSRDLAGLLLADIERAIEHFKHHPAVKPLTHKEGGGFRH
jgi:glutamate decarboxylase